MWEKLTIVIFDLEGVLIDNSRRLRYALDRVGAKDVRSLSYPKRGKFWKIFLDRNLAHKLDTVNMVGLEMLVDRAKKHRIAIVSGSPCQIVKDHMEKINMMLGKMGEKVEIGYIFCRKGTREKAPEFKERIIKRLLLEDEVVEIHDDDERVLERAKKYGIKCILWVDLNPVDN